MGIQRAKGHASYVATYLVKYKDSTTMKPALAPSHVNKQNKAHEHAHHYKHGLRC